MSTIKIRIPLNVTVPVSEGAAVEQMRNALERLVKVGGLYGDLDKFLVDYELSPGDDSITAEIEREALVDASYFLTVGGGLSLDDSKFDWERRKVDLPKTFSVATINERMKRSKRPIRNQFQLTIKDYQRYWKQRKKSLLKDKEKVNTLVNLFTNDLMLIFNQVLPEIQEGRQLTTLLGTTQVSQGLSKAARELSLAYRKALKQESSQGAPNKNIYMQLKDKYSKFLSELILVVFDGINGEFDSREGQKDKPKEKRGFNLFKRK